MAVQFKLCLQVSFTLLVYLSSLICAQNFRREKQGVSFAKFIRTPSVKLDVYSLASLSVSKLGECTFECLNLKGCESVNFGRTSFDGKHSCELLRIKKFAKAKQVVPNDEFDHYYIKTPCMSYPCQNGATCRPSYSKDDYSCGCKAGFTGKHCDKVNWIKMKSQSRGSPVCFGDSGDTPGNFKTPSSGKVITFKLIHLHGSVSCSKGNHYSNWGCTYFNGPKNLETLITSSNQTRLLPNDDKLFNANVSCEGFLLYYRLPGQNPNSTELLFDNFTEPLPVKAGEQFAIWFGEDLYDCGDTDNGGEQACVEVYGLFV